MVSHILAEKHDHYYFTEGITTAERCEGTDPMRKYRVKTVTVRTFKTEKSMRDYCNKELGWKW